MREFLRDVKTRQALRNFYDFRFAFSDDSQACPNFDAFLNWLLVHSRSEGFNIVCESEIRSYLRRKNIFGKLSRIEYSIFRHRQTVDPNFNRTISEDDFRAWLEHYGAREYPELRSLNDQESVELLDTTSDEAEVLIVCPRSRKTGVGNLAENLVNLCQDLGLSVRLIDFEFAGNTPDFRSEFCRSALTVKKIIYCISLIEFNYLFYVLGPKLIAANAPKSIYYGPWELDQIPRTLTAALCGVSEIWAISRFVFEGFLLCHPNVVDMGTLCNQRRIPSDRLLKDVGGGEFSFLNVCAKGSYLERKNPHGVLKAFLSAFPREHGTPRVRLRIHLTDVSRDEIPADLQLLDDRVVVTAGYLSSEEFAALFDESDCFVSLHRAEGFGYAVSEAFDSGLRVITSNYGGVLEFCNDDNSRLIQVRVSQIGSNVYPHSAGLYWAEPSLDDATQAMSECLAVGRTERLTGRLAAYSNEVRRKISARLVELFDEGNTV